MPIHSFNCPFSACIFFEIIYIILSLVSPLPTVVEQPAQPTVDEVAQRRIADLEAQVQRISTELSDVLEKEVRPFCDIEAPLSRVTPATHCCIICYINLCNFFLIILFI